MESGADRCEQKGTAAPSVDGGATRRDILNSCAVAGPVAALCACGVLLALPVWIAPMPAMPDYPAHLATFYLLGGGARLPLLAHFYHVQWAFIPNLAAEAIVPPVSRVLGLGTATAVFLSFAIALWVSGAGAVQWALYRRVGAAPLIAGLFAYNTNFMWGFFNYCLGAGLAFLAFAGWIADRNRRQPMHLAAFAAAALALYFCHLFAVAVFFLLISCFEISGSQRPWVGLQALRRAGAVVVVGLPTAIAFLFLRPSEGGGPITFNFLDTFQDRLSAAAQFSFDNPDWPLLGALLALFAIGMWRRKISIHPRLKLALAVLLLASALAPEWAMGGWGVDLRLPAVLAALACASAEFRFDHRTTGVLIVSAVLVAAWNAAALSGNWLYYDRRFAEFRTAARSLAPGSKIMTVLDGDAIGLASDQPYWHMAEYAIIDRQAFTPLLFTTEGQHVVHLQPGVASIAAKSAEQGSPPDISELDDLAAGNANDDTDIRKVFPYLLRFQCHFDVALVVHLGGRRSTVPDMLKLEHAGSFFSLYRIRRGQDCGAG